MKPSARSRRRGSGRCLREVKGQAYRIYDDKGQPVAWAGANNYYDGDVITLTGGEVSGQDAAESIGLPSVPGSWEGPFWLVSQVETGMPGDISPD